MKSAIRWLAFALLLPIVLVENVALAWGGATTIYAVFTGGTITQALNISAVTNDITTPGSEDLRLSAGGSVVLKNGDNNVDIEDSNGVVRGQMSTNTAQTTFSVSQNLSSGARLRLSASAILLGRIDDANTTTTIGGFADGLDTGGGGQFVGEQVFGDGLIAQPSPQTTSATCAAGTLALDPKSDVVVVDSNAANCTVTLAAAGFVNTINLESKPIRITAKNVGAGKLSFATTNFAVAPPARCQSGTGFGAGQSALVAWSKDQGKWTFLGGCE